MAGHFTVMDYVVFLGTIAISMLIGVYYAFIKKQKTNTDLLVGKRVVFKKAAYPYDPSIACLILFAF